MANNCPCNPPATGVPAGPAVPWHRLLPASPRAGHRHPDPQGPKGMEGGCPSRSSFGGQKVKSVKETQDPVRVDGGDKWLRGQTEEHGPRHTPLSSPRHQLTKIKEKLLWPNSPCPMPGISSLAPGIPACLDAAGSVGAQPWGTSVGNIPMPQKQSHGADTQKSCERHLRSTGDYQSRRTDSNLQSLSLPWVK